MAAILAGTVAIVGSVPAQQAITSRLGAVVWMMAFGVPLLAVLASLPLRSAVMATAGWTGVCWMLTSTAGSLESVWTSRLPLLAGVALAAAYWVDQALPGRPVPRWYVGPRWRARGAAPRRRGWR